MVKILLCGELQGQWELVFDRVKKLNASAKGAPFEALICIGQAFPFPSSYLSGETQAPIPTYFLPAHEHEDIWQQDDQQKTIYDKIVKAGNEPTEVLKNVFYLGKAGITTIAGLNMAYLSGVAVDDEKKATSPLYYSKDTIQELIQQLQKEDTPAIDFFFTAEYPKDFQNLLPDQQIPSELQTIKGSDGIRDIMQAVYPKYHITSTGGVFYQRLPYVSEHKTTSRKQITRLIGLCNVNGSKDRAKKYLHALQVVPSAEQAGNDGNNPVDIPAGTTQNPYLHVPTIQSQEHNEPAHKRRKVEPPSGLSAEQVAQLTAQSGQGAQYFYDQKIAARGQHPNALRPNSNHHNRDRQNNRRRAPMVPDREECWFCLATPSVERHLIVSIGQEAYLAMPKGAINPDHLLIVPIAHEASMQKLSTAAHKEIERFKSVLREYFASQEKEMIVFDRNIATIGAAHTHLQVVGVPNAKAASARKIFEVEGEKYNVRFEELDRHDDLGEKTDGRPYFYAEVPSGDKGQSSPVRLLHFVEGKHYMQFGRHAVACLLDVPRRANWKFCVVPKSEEIEMTQTFKHKWQKFDFTLEEDDDN